jgi:zinc/manganese transport system substrate-binding protein
MIIMNRRIKAIIAAVAMLVPSSAWATLNVFACEPEWGALASEIGGGKVAVYTATTALQDVHHIEARPSLIARARKADLVVCTGGGLEAGWLPLVQSQAGNPRIRAGQPGYFEASSLVARLEIPAQVDRAQGDVHAGGNPHVHLDPRNISMVATALSRRLAQLDSANAVHYEMRVHRFLERWQQAIEGWEKRAARLRGVPVIVHHRDASYLIHWLRLREIGQLEPKPGLPPTTSHLSGLVAQQTKDPAAAILRSAYNDPRAGDWLSEQTKVPVVTLPYTVGGNDRARDLFGLFEDTVSRLLAVVK